MLLEDMKKTIASVFVYICIRFYAHVDSSSFKRKNKRVHAVIHNLHTEFQRNIFDSSSRVILTSLNSGTLSKIHQYFCIVSKQLCSHLRPTVDHLFLVNSPVQRNYMCSTLHPARNLNPTPDPEHSLHGSQPSVGARCSQNCE